MANYQTALKRIKTTNQVIDMNVEIVQAAENNFYDGKIRHVLQSVLFDIKWCV